MRIGKRRSRKKKKLIVFLSVSLILVLGCAILFSWFIPEQSLDLTASYEKKGDQAYAENSYNAALSYWQMAVREERDQEGLFLKIGRANLKLSNPESAREAFEKALKINPLDNDAQKELASILFILGDMDAVHTKLQELAPRMKNDPGFFILWGDFFMNSGEYEKAESLYEKAGSLKPDSYRGMIKLAICKSQAGKQQEAAKLISGVPEEKINTISDLLLLADYYFLFSDFSRAESLLDKAVEEDPGGIMVLMTQYRFYLDTGMVNKAESLISSLVEQYPNDLRFKLMLADLHLSSLKMDKAEVLLEKAKALRDRFDYQALMGKFWLFKGKFSHAVSNLEAAVDRNPGLLSAYYLLGVAYFAGGQVNLAEKCFIEVLVLNPYHTNTLLALAGLYYKGKEYPLALQYLDRAISHEPSNPRGYQIKGLCLSAMGKNEEASRAFSKAWILGENVSSLFFLAESLGKRQAYNSALKIYEDVLEREPEFYEALNGAAFLMEKAGKGRTVLERIDRMIREGGAHPVLYHTAARISLDLNNYERCRKYLESAMTRDYVSGEIYMLWADLHMAEGEPEKAADALSECTKKRPSYLNAWLRLADHYVRMNEYGSARETLELAVKQFPDHPEVTGNLSWLLIEEGTDFDRALTLARSAYDKLPDQPWLMDTLGWAYFHKHAYSQAEWMLAASEEKSPGNGLIKYHQGMVFYRLGRLSEAKEKFESAMEHDDLKERDRALIKVLLADFNKDKKHDNLSDGVLFDPDKGAENSDVFDEEDDVLEPDWSKFKSHL